MLLACLTPFGSQPTGLLTGKSIGEGPVGSYKLTLIAQPVAVLGPLCMHPLVSVFPSEQKFGCFLKHLDGIFCYTVGAVPLQLRL